LTLYFYEQQPSTEGIHLDLQKHLSGFTSPAISSPSCEIKNELSFPPLPATSNQQQQQTISQPVQQSQPEAAKGPPKGLSDLEEQLSKIHQKPFIQQQQQQQQQPAQPHPSYSEAVRQSPTTVQQQFPPVVNTITTATPTSAQKVSRFQVSKVEEQKAAAAAVKPLLSPEIEVNLMPSLQQPSLPIQMGVPQSSQAQSFFQQHQGGVVSVDFFFSVLLRSMPVFLLFDVFQKPIYIVTSTLQVIQLLTYLTLVCGLYSSFDLNPFFVVLTF
jgi:hypothetical protein